MLTPIPITETIKGALLKLGVLAAGEELAGPEAQDSLMALNRVIDLFNTDGVSISHTTRTVLQAPYTVNRCDYPDTTDETRVWKSYVSLGKCMDYNMIPPIGFDTLYFRESGGTDYPLKIFGADQWQNIAVKNVTGIPSHVYVSKGAGNSMILNFDMIPQDNLTLIGDFRMPYTGTDANNNKYVATDEIQWDFGVEPMLMYALAIELADEYQVKDISLIAAKLDSISQAVYKRNAPDLRMNVEGSYTRRGSDRKNRARY